jgi:hypothetical protein
MTVAALLGTSVADQDSGAVEGIAISPRSARRLLFFLAIVAISVDPCLSVVPRLFKEIQRIELFGPLDCGSPLPLCCWQPAAKPRGLKAR